MKQTKILYIITKLAVGGAQDTVIDSVEHLNKAKKIYSEIACGPIEKNVGNLENLAISKGIRLVKIQGLTNNIKPISNIRALFILYKYIKKKKFQIVHTHSSVAGIIGRIAARFAKIPVIIHTVHGWGIRPDMPKIKQKVYIWLERFCERFTDKLIVVSKFNIDKGLKYKVGKPSKYTVIHSGIDIKKFSKEINTKEKKKQLGLDEDKPVVGMIGRLDAQKNPLDFVKSAGIIQKRFPNVQFIIVGDGPLRKQTEALINRLNVKNFHLLGFRRDVDEILQIIDISVLTSLWEGLPRVFPESMAAKKPIVATNVDGAPEAIIDGETGFIVQPKQPEALAEKVLFLLNNPNKSKQMGIKAFKRVNQFSLSRMLKDIDSLYDELLTQ